MNEAGYREVFFTAQDGLRLYYRDYGEPLGKALPLICLPGLTRNAKDFAGLAARLGPGRRVICADYRGRGRSARDGNWRNYRPPNIVNDVLHLLTAAEIHRVIVCGTSFGGLLAMGLAAARPIVLAGVILNDVGPEVSEEGRRRILAYVRDARPQPDWPSAVAHLKATFPALSFSGDAAWLNFARSTYREGEDGKLHPDWDPALARPFAEPDLAGFDVWRLYGALRPFPTMAIRGGLSDVLAPETFARMAELKPDLEAVTLEGVGHAPTLGEPLARQAIDDHLTRLDAA